MDAYDIIPFLSFRLITISSVQCDWNDVRSFLAKSSIIPFRNTVECCTFNVPLGSKHHFICTSTGMQCVINHKTETLRSECSFCLKRNILDSTLEPWMNKYEAKRPPWYEIIAVLLILKLGACPDQRSQSGLNSESRRSKRLENVRFGVHDQGFSY